MLPEKEFLITNGIGGYASSTLVGANTRKYHGLLIGSDEHLERFVFVSLLSERLVLPEEEVSLATIYYPGNVVFPDARPFFSSYVNHPTPITTFKHKDVVVHKSITLVKGHNEVHINYKIKSSLQVPFIVEPLLTDRNIYEVFFANQMNHIVAIRQSERQFQFQSTHGFIITVSSTHGEFLPKRQYYYNVYHPKDTQDKLEDQEDLVSLGYFTYQLQPGIQEIVFTLKAQKSETELSSKMEKIVFEPAKEIVKSFYVNRTIERRKRLDEVIRLSEKFVVLVDGNPSIIAGYHWFKDWGRDTFIAFGGLLLDTKRFVLAREILLTWANAINYGLVPNRLHDNDYGSIDASLWFVKSIWDYYRKSNDATILRHLYPTIQNMFKSFMKGTLFGIHIDESGFLVYTDASKALTWMDAKVNDKPVIDRSGAAVEIQGLWFHMLHVIKKIEQELGEDVLSPDADKYISLFERHFMNTFYDQRQSYLYDSIQGGSKIKSIRPNQLIALAYEFSPVPREISQKILDTVEKSLLTSRGLKTLDSQDPAYRSFYQGSMVDRDASYHQGTIWPWLFGPFICAYVRAYPESKEIRQNCKVLLDNYVDEVLTNEGYDLPEIYEVETLEPRGCIAQAWTVGQIIEAYGAISMIN